MKKKESHWKYVDGTYGISAGTIFNGEWKGLKRYCPLKVFFNGHTGEYRFFSVNFFNENGADKTPTNGSRTAWRAAMKTNSSNLYH
jgi:hypothetical protein